MRVKAHRILTPLYLANELTRSRTLTESQRIQEHADVKWKELAEREGKGFQEEERRVFSWW